MPAIQPIPQNTPDPAKVEAAQILATHNKATVARTRTPARWMPNVKRGAVNGENSGRRVK